MTPYWVAHGIHILISIELLQETLQKGNSYCQEVIVYQGILRTLHTLFESAHKLTDDIKSQHPSVNWRMFSSLRNILVHDYLGDFSWEDALSLINEDLPALKLAMLYHIPNWDIIKQEYAPR
jgi:uncharacterized protein with HEPN domain